MVYNENIAFNSEVIHSLWCSLETKYTGLPTTVWEESTHKNSITPL